MNVYSVFKDQRDVVICYILILRVLPSDFYQPVATFGLVFVVCSDIIRGNQPTPTAPELLSAKPFSLFLILSENPFFPKADNL